MNKIAKLGDIYCIKSQRCNKWASYQVVEEDNTKVALMALDWFSHDLPSENELIDIKPLDFKGRIDICYTMYKGVPNRFVYVGNMKPLAVKEVIAYGDWPDNYLVQESKYSWSQHSEDEIKRYRNAEKSNEIFNICGKEIERRTRNVLLAENLFEPSLGRHFDNGLENFSNWAELDKLGALTEIRYEGSDEEILNYLANRKLIGTLNWNRHGKKKIDVSKTHLLTLAIDPENLEKLILNENLRWLAFNSKEDDLSKLQIEDKNKGQFLSLTLNLKSEKVPNLKLPNLSDLYIWAKDIDAKEIVDNYPNLQSLHIWGGPGNIYNVSELGRLKKLRYLQLKDLFGFKAEEFPRYKELESIENLWLTGMSAECCKIIKKDYKDCLQIRVSQAHSEKWIEANIDNPFRNWDGRENLPARQAKAAFNAHKKAMSELSKVSSPKENVEVINEILKAYVLTFNKMKSIETIEREEIADNFYMLLKKSNLEGDEKLYMDLFNQWRDF